MAFRLINPAPQFFTVDGKVLAGGNLYFTDTGTSNPRPTYADPGLSAENTNPVILDASGRANADIWMDGVYRVVLKDSSGATMWTRDDVQGPADLPGLAGQEGYFLSTDGETLIWKPVLQVPDVSGQADKILTNDGATPYWADPSSQLPAQTGHAGQFLTTDGTDASWAAIAGASSTSGSITVGNQLVQFGIDTAPSSGGKTTSKSVTFPTAYASAPRVFIQPNGSGPTPSGIYVRASALTINAGNFTAGFSTATGGTSADNYSRSNITSSFTFGWLAVGTKA
ncbi:hypothetical protein [Rhodanobacter caeni]|uniref:Tail fiber protein n=1 Tax=Rhodanobacter caeni TaxID=657654 RepID=A0ABN0UT30_9GAMM